jgi:eukaryotic-like serine/threonine-protein kinase
MPAMSDDVPTRPLRADDQRTEVELVTELVDIEDVALASETDRWKPVRVIGRGGMGEVRLVRDTRISRAVAVKVLRAKLASDTAYRSRFLAEARIQGQLEHPSIVPVHDLGETGDGELYFAMKHVRGVTLRAALKDRGGKYTRRRLLTAFSSVCLAVEFAHRRGVVHRDLKPENVMLGDFGEVYVLDWGIAKVMHGPEAPLADTLDLPGDSPATHAGTVLGTPNYMAPERRRGHADARSDVFALGVILNELLEVAPELEIAPELVAIVERACAHEPADRFATARELHDALERYLDGDRDLETRRAVAQTHAQRAAAALEREARDEAGHEVGRALGLDPTNGVALRTLMQLLATAPAELPPAAEAELHQRWRERRVRTLRASTVTTCSFLTILPLIAWLGIRDPNLFAAYVAVALGASGLQYAASRTEHRLPIVLAFLFTNGAAALLASSLGMLGAVPGAFAILAMAWRMNYARAMHGVLILLGTFAAVAAALYAFPPRVTADGIVIAPHMHALPAPGATLALAVGMFGTVAVAVLYGRIFSKEIQRADRQLVFHAWQLRQLLPPAS